MRDVFQEPNPIIQFGTLRKTWVFPALFSSGSKQASSPHLASSCTASSNCVGSNPQHQIPQRHHQLEVTVLGSHARTARRPTSSGKRRTRCLKFGICWPRPATSSPCDLHRTPTSLQNSRLDREPGALIGASAQQPTLSLDKPNQSGYGKTEREPL